MPSANLRDCPSTGEPCAAKAACTVRRGANGKGPTGNGRYLAGGLPYFTHPLPVSSTLGERVPELRADIDSSHDSGARA